METFSYGTRQQVEFEIDIDSCVNVGSILQGAAREHPKRRLLQFLDRLPFNSKMNSWKVCRSLRRIIARVTQLSIIVGLRVRQADEERLGGAVLIVGEGNDHVSRGSDSYKSQEKNPNQRMQRYGGHDSEELALRLITKQLAIDTLCGGRVLRAGRERTYLAARQYHIRSLHMPREESKQ